MVGLSDQSLSISGEIPEGARMAAESYVDEWYQRAQIDPSFYGVVGKQVDRDRFVLGEGYIFYYVHEADAIRFAESSELDPRGFATAVVYEYPLFLDNELIATLHIKPNRNHNGEPIFSDRGDYRPSGFRSPDGPLDDLLVDLMRIAETGDAEFAVIKFVCGAGGVYIRITRAEGSAEIIPLGPWEMSILRIGGSLPVAERNAATEIKRAILEKKGE